MSSWSSSHYLNTLSPVVRKIIIFDNHFRRSLNMSNLSHKNTELVPTYKYYKKINNGLNGWMECCALMLKGPMLYHTSHTMRITVILKRLTYIFRNIKSAMKDETKCCAAFFEIPGCLFCWRAIEVGKWNIEH